MEESYEWGGLGDEGIMKTRVNRAWGIRGKGAKGDWES